MIQIASMFNETLTLSDGTSNHAYSTISTGALSRLRRVSETDLNTPETLEIKHEQNDKTNVSRSLVKFSTRVVNATTGKAADVIVHAVLTVPRDVATATDVTKVVNQFNAFMATSGYVDKLINMES